MEEIGTAIQIDMDTIAVEWEEAADKNQVGMAIPDGIMVAQETGIAALARVTADLVAMVTGNLKEIGIMVLEDMAAGQWKIGIVVQVDKVQTDTVMDQKKIGIAEREDMATALDQAPAEWENCQVPATGALPVGLHQCEDSHLWVTGKDDHPNGIVTGSKSWDSI